MASELQASFVAGKTCYFLVRSSVGTIWNGSALVTYVTADYADYVIAATEQGTASAYYAADFPSGLANGRYNYVAKDQVGGSPAETDITVATGEIVWAGPAVGLVPLVNSSGAVLVGSGLFATVLPATLSGVNAIVPPANLSGINVIAGSGAFAVVPIASISGVNVVVPIATISGVNAVVPPANLSGVSVIAGSGVFATVPITSISGVNAVVPPTNLSGVSVIAGSGAFAAVPPSSISGVNAIVPVASLSGLVTNSGLWVNARLLDNVVHGGETARLRLGCSGSNEPALLVTADRTALAAVRFYHSEEGIAFDIAANSGPGLSIDGSLAGIRVTTAGNNLGAIHVTSQLTPAVSLNAGSGQVALHLLGQLQVTSGIVANISGNLWGDVYRVVSGVTAGTVSLASGQFVNVYSGQLSGYLVTPASGAFSTVSLNSGQLVNLFSGERAAITNTILDLPQTIESGVGTNSGLTVREAFRGIAAATFGESSGFLSGFVNADVRYQNAVGNTLARVVGHIDALGNRSGITVNLR